MANNVLNWVWEHSRSRHAARLVLLAIADRAKEHDHVAWMSNKKLRQMTGLGERSVQAGVTELVKLGELWVGIQQGPGGVNKYRVLMKVSRQNPAESAPPPQDQHPVESVQGGADLPDEEFVEVEVVDPAESAPPPQDQHPPAGSAPRTHVEPTNSPAESSKGGVGGDALFAGESHRPAKRPRRTRPAPGPEFERWYSTYPVHKARGDAEKAWVAAIAAGASPEDLIAAAERYAKDPQVLRGYGKYPAGWLRAKCWLDEPTPEQQNLPATNGHRPPVDRRQQATDEFFDRAINRARERDAASQRESA